ncbi:MAG: hypothetical protein ACTSPQ_00390 [Candidatus Helarchaeota archaeon]
MLKNIYIFLADGILLFDKGWEDLNQDPMLISGFCSALWMFSKQIGGEDFELLKTKRYLILGTSSEKYQIKFILIIDHSDDIDEHIKLLEDIKQDFCSIYREDLEKIKSKEIPIRLNYFKDYSNRINAVIKNHFPNLIPEMVMQ